MSKFIVGLACIRFNLSAIATGLTPAARRNIPDAARPRAAGTPYGSLGQYGGMVWPCGVYAGRDGSDGRALDGGCRKQRAHKH